MEIYRYAAQKGLLVTIFTNGTLLTPQLADELASRAQAAGLRALAVETQNTNVAAIRFYRSVGFAIEGIDLSYYSNIDVEDGEVAIFLKRKLP